MNYLRFNEMAARQNNLFLSLFIFNVNVCIVLGGLSKQKLMVKIDRMEICYRSKDTPTNVHNYMITYNYDIGYSLDVDIDLLRDLDNDKIWGSMRLERCASREALDTCEPFAVLKPPIHLCHFLNMKGMGMDHVFESFKPPLRCPFKKGKIVGKNVIFNPDLFTMFPITGYYWKIYGDWGEGHKLYATSCFEGSFVNTRASGSYNITMT